MLLELWGHPAPGWEVPSLLSPPGVLCAAVHVAEKDEVSAAYNARSSLPCVLQPMQLRRLSWLRSAAAVRPSGRQPKRPASSACATTWRRTCWRWALIVSRLCIEVASVCG